MNPYQPPKRTGSIIFPSAPVSVDVVRDNVRAIVGKIVNENPGFPLTPIVGALVWELPEEHFRALSPSVIRAMIDDMAENGEITRLEARRNEGLPSEFTYYPPGYSFACIPRSLFLGTPTTPKGLQADLNETQQMKVSALTNLLETSSKEVVLHVVTKFCHRCGSLNEGHFCNE